MQPLEEQIHELLTQIPQLHEKYNQQKLSNAQHRIQNAHITYTTATTRKLLKTTYIDQLRVRLNDTEEKRIYEIIRKNNPITQTTKLRARNTQNRETKRNFLSQLIYLEQKHHIPITEPTKQLNTYIQNLLNN